MNKKEFLTELTKKNWAYFHNHVDVDEVVDSFSFNECMLIVYNFREDDSWESDLEEKSVALLKKIREHFPNEWGADWKNEYFFAITCMNGYKYQEAFETLRMLYDSLKNPPSGLVCAYLFVSSFPDQYISPKEEMRLALEAAEQGYTSETARALQSAYARNKQSDESEKFRLIAEDLEKRGIHSPAIWPDLFKELKGH